MVRATTPVRSRDFSERWALVVAAVALCLLIGLNAVVAMCWLAVGRAASKSEGVLFGSAIFVLGFVAVGVALLALPAILRHPRVMWPRFVFILGFCPLPMGFIISWLRTAFL